jgi:hypothetical protein
MTTGATIVNAARVPIFTSSAVVSKGRNHVSTKVTALTRKSTSSKEPGFFSGYAHLLLP